MIRLILPETAAGQSFDGIVRLLFLFTYGAS